MPLLNIMCPICTDSFNNADDVYSTSCGHLFHFSCMNEWQRRGTSCPQCRHYNPTTHKLYLSFDETSENVEKQDELELKLKTSNEKITQLLVQMSESETNFLQLQKQFTAIENVKKGLEERIRQMNDSEDNFLNLQGQYTESSELVKALQDRIQQLFIENECKSKELQLKRLENESLKTSLEAGENNLSDGILHEKIKVLERKLKHISDEFEKEIATSTQLSIEKMKLQSYVNHFNSLEKESDKTPNVKKNREHLKGNITKRPFERNSNPSNDGNINNVFIKGLSLDLITIPLTNVIVNLASKMNMSISEDDLIKVNFVGNKEQESFTAQLCAQFKSNKLKEEFISKKVMLKNNPTTRSIVISEFMNDEVFALFKYAKEKLRDSGFNCIFTKGNQVFAKRNRSQRYGVRIENRKQVDIMSKAHQEEASQEKVNNDKLVDENFYQL